jgi:hypothetical protein
MIIEGAANRASNCVKSKQGEDLGVFVAIAAQQ